ncbi:MAG: hypothetical protein ABIP20_12400, partial [Chthoniobacteraceae bacterium]
YLKRILKSDTFDEIAAHLGRAKPVKAEAVAKIRTRPNALLGDAKPEISLKVAVTAEGVVLQTADDLPLARLTSAHNLKWAALAKEGAALLLFQGDGCVAEEFRIAHPENLMSFDAGHVEIAPPGTKPPKAVVVPKRRKALRPGDDL